MQIDYAKEIISRIDSRDFFEHYGLNPNRQSNISCPFHSEKTPSLHIYPENRGWHCFGCGKGGNIIDFAIEYFELTFLETIEKLNIDFNLDLPIGRRMTMKERHKLAESSRKAKEKRAEVAKSREEFEREYFELIDKITECEKLMRGNNPGSENWARGARMIDYYSYCLGEIIGRAFINGRRANNSNF